MPFNSGKRNLLPLVRRLGGGAAASAATPATQRGNIDYDQLRTSARSGNGPLLQMSASAAPVAGHVPIYDAYGNLIDSGQVALLTGAPATHASSGTPGQIAYDSSGNFYFCYAVNLWARQGPGGYSNSF